MSFFIAMAGAACSPWHFGSRTLLAQGDAVSGRGEGHAAAALLALRGAVADQNLLHSDRYILFPQVEELSLEEASLRLATLPKPVMCSASPKGGVLVVRCGKLDPVTRGIHRHAVAALQEWLRSSLPDNVKTLADPPILLRAGDRSIVLKLSVGLQFLEDFHIVFSSTVSPPDAEAHAKGAAAVWAFEPGADLQVNERGIEVKQRP
jgi:hypothetical protein